MKKTEFDHKGWKGIIAKDFTVDFIARLARAIGIWLINKSPFPSVVIGYDCRFGGKLFAENMAKVLAMTYIKVHFASDTVAMGMLSNGVLDMEADLGIYLTAGIHSFEYNGVYLKDKQGRSLEKNEIKNIADLIPGQNEIDPDLLKMDRYKSSGLINPVNLENLYIQKIQNQFKNSLFTKQLPYAVDFMHGAAAPAVQKLLPNLTVIHQECNPGFNGIPPQPTESNLAQLKKMVSESNEIKGGIAFDGAAENIAIIDEKGNFIEYNKMVVMLIYTLAQYDPPLSRVILGKPITTAIEKLAEKYHFELIRTEDNDAKCIRELKSTKGNFAALAFQGIALGDHLHERDGIFMALKFLEIIENKQLVISELLEEALAVTGNFSYERSALQVKKDDIKRFKDQVENGTIQALGKYRVKEIESFNGYRFVINDQKWILVRPSFQKMIFHFFVQAEDYEEVKELLRETYRTIIK